MAREIAIGKALNVFEGRVNQSNAWATCFEHIDFSSNNNASGERK